MLTLTHESILSWTVYIPSAINIEYWINIGYWIFVFRIFLFCLSLRTNVKLNSIRGYLFSRIICFPRIHRHVDVSAISIGLCHVLNSVNSVNWRRMRKSYFLLSWYFEFQGRAPPSVELLFEWSEQWRQSESFKSNRISNLATSRRWPENLLVSFYERGKERKNIHWK